MDAACPLELTPQEYDAIKQCEAVVIREYETPGGSRVGKAVAWGDADEMRHQADTPGLFVVPVGLSIICQQVLLVSDLLGDG